MTNSVSSAHLIFSLSLGASGLLSKLSLVPTRNLLSVFRDQTLTNAKDAEISRITPYPVEAILEFLSFKDEEVHEVLKSNPLGKATDQDEIKNRILQQLPPEI